MMVAAALGATVAGAAAAPTIARLTPPSELFASGQPAPVIARFLPGQRFDLQATVQPDAGATITGFRFAVDGVELTSINGTTSRVTTGLASGLPAGTAVVSQRAYSTLAPGVHTLKVAAT
jgi:alkaline phosphatase